METLHQPVLLNEVMEYLKPVDGGIYVDGNLGLGGHTERILEESSPGGRVVGFELDEKALSHSQKRLKPFGDRVSFMHRNFSEIKLALDDLAIAEVDGVLLDLGLSSMQLDTGGRGFSFKGSEPLDMRMDLRSEMTAETYINRATRDELADIFFYYGEERQARRIADFIDDFRKKQMITTTDQLVGIIERAVPKRFHPKKIHVATRVFQGLRIAVNNELVNLEKVLGAGGDVLKNGARFCVISFHSLEDRLVKKAFRENPDFKELTKKPLMASDEECRINPRARSAKMRVAEMGRRK
ncbi:MAG: 16S rRNA (cytosine(1402)-N(4))-methyltransferase RsmH [Proteobacteria bacterium]|nr:16S rRNA (cytosine(1402)-N(4))-methyltransferase RsmH [Pseudomonadota bacterium]MBU1711046.1 16S rRNA (cytosine(1402)-N(4))-methyltransferase RsmH [Pseudomonadota bacterium]